MIDHCEDLNLSAGGDMHEGAQSVRLGLRGIPRASEDVMVARDILLAELTGARYHVAHISTQQLGGNGGVCAKRAGLPVTCEATPHHFALADADMAPYDSNYKMKPPLRDTSDVAAVIEGLVNGTIDAIATDHAPHPGGEKMQEFERCPFGIIGLETAIGLSLETSVSQPKNNLAAPCRAVYAESRARFFARSRNAEARRASGHYVFGLNHNWTYDVNRSASKSRNTPFHGYKFRGGPVATIVAGKIVWQAG